MSGERAMRALNWRICSALSRAAVSAAAAIWRVFLTVWVREGVLMSSAMGRWAWASRFSR